MYQATGISSKHILVAVLPGLPTSAELFILPYQDATGENKRTAADLEQVLCPLLGEVYVYTFVYIYVGFPRQVRTNNCGTNASDSLGSKQRLWYMLHPLCFFIGFLVLFWGYLFCPKHWKQALEICLGVETPIWFPSVMSNWHKFE